LPDNIDNNPFFCKVLRFRDDSVMGDKKGRLWGPFIEIRSSGSFEFGVKFLGKNLKIFASENLNLMVIFGVFSGRRGIGII